MEKTLSTTHPFLFDRTWRLTVTNNAQKLDTARILSKCQLNPKSNDHWSRWSPSITTLNNVPAPCAIRLDYMVSHKWGYNMGDLGLTVGCASRISNMFSHESCPWVWSPNTILHFISFCFICANIVHWHSPSVNNHYMANWVIMRKNSSVSETIYIISICF